MDGDRAVIVAELDLQTVEQEIIGSLRQEFILSAEPPLETIDATITVRADKGEPLTFGDTDDGGFAMRLADEFREDRGAALINSEGLNIWGKPAKWIDYSTTMEGKQVGVAMFGHPSNIRHPTRWHAREYSFCSANPFGLSSFTGDKNNNGSYTVNAGDSITFRYRVVVHEGESSRETIEQLYGRFAAQ